MTKKYAIHAFSRRDERTDDFDAAIGRARQLSRETGHAEVSAPDGLVGQFAGGKATPEFAHLDVPAPSSMVDREKLAMLLHAVGQLTFGDMRENPRCKAIWDAYKDFTAD